MTTHQDAVSLKYIYKLMYIYQMSIIQGESKEKALHHVKEMAQQDEYNIPFPLTATIKRWIQGTHNVDDLLLQATQLLKQQFAERLEKESSDIHTPSFTENFETAYIKHAEELVASYKECCVS